MILGDSTLLPMPNHLGWSRLEGWLFPLEKERGVDGKTPRKISLPWTQNLNCGRREAPKGIVPRGRTSHLRAKTQYKSQMQQATSLNSPTQLTRLKAKLYTAEERLTDWLTDYLEERRFFCWLNSTEWFCSFVYSNRRQHFINWVTYYRNTQRNKTQKTQVQDRP